MSAPLDASKLKITRVANRKTYPPNKDLVFGQVMTDHILTCEWDSTNGWHAPKIKPYEKFQLDPAATVFHYAFCCFEGQKAFIGEDGKTRIFRPDRNITRLNKSTSRIALPNLDVDQGVELLKKFVEVERDVIPQGRGMSLYLRPTVISTNPSLGINNPSSALFYIIASPVGQIVKGGPVRLKATDEFTRAWPGGTGDTKLGANYSPCVIATQLAIKQGFTQNLWLFNGFITEVGMMNFFVVFKNNETGKRELTTAPLDGIILEGVTRMSILELARERLDNSLFEVVERPVHIDEFMKRHKEGELLEAFGAGTAAIVSPVSEVNYHGEPAVLPTPPNGGELTNLILKWIQDIQYGIDDHPFCQIIG